MRIFVFSADFRVFCTGNNCHGNFIQIKITCHCNYYASVQILSKQLSPASRREGLHPRGEGLESEKHACIPTGMLSCCDMSVQKVLYQ